MRQDSKNLALKLTAVTGAVALFAILGSSSYSEPTTDSDSTEAVSTVSPTRDPVYKVSEEKKALMVKRNGPIFENWQKPVVTFLLTSSQNGYVEPCGCAGLDNMKGGLKRRHSLLKQLKADGWPVVALDAGNQVKRFGPQTEIKFRYIVQALEKLDYKAVGFGLNDLRMDILAVAVNLNPETNPFVSANVALVDFESGFTKRFRIIEAGGKKIGVTTVLGKAEQIQVPNSDAFSVIDPSMALKEVVPKMQAAGCDLMILLANTSTKETQALAKEFPAFDFVVCPGDSEVAPDKVIDIPGTKTKLIETGHKGTYLPMLGIYDNPSEPFKYQLVPLDARFPDSKEMHENMRKYQKDLETIGLLQLVNNRSEFKLGRTFVGSEACGDCHSSAMEVFEDSPHAHATKTLVELKPSRQFDPECLSCHVTGWNPQKFFPYKSGYLGINKTPKLIDNGCENCHGPASKHVAMENDDSQTDAAREPFRAELRLEIGENEGNKKGQKSDGKVIKMCLECHDGDNSPKFDFQEYWENDIVHQGKD